MARHKAYDDCDIPDNFVLPEGNVRRGQKIFKNKCAQCHTIRKDNKNPYGSLLGPNLYGVIGRTAARNQRTGWIKYSTAMEEAGILWTERNLMAFLKNPRAFAGGAINMNFRGLDDFQDRVDVVYYLKKAGHEDWMVRDGTPHSQREWWGRNGSKARPAHWQSADDKDLKPWEFVYRAVRGGLSSFVPESSNGSADGRGTVESESSKDVDKWRRVNAVEDGVHAATMHSALNWPPQEVISQGPVTKERPAQATRNTSPAGSPPGKDKARSHFASPALLGCEEHIPSSETGTRAPSGLMVFRDRSPQPPPALPAQTAASPAPAQQLPASPAPPVPAVPVLTPVPTVDGGFRWPCGLVAYREAR